MFWLDDALESMIGLDGVVTVVDAKYSIKVITLLLYIYKLLGL